MSQIDQPSGFAIPLVADNLAVARKTVWRGGTTLTGSYPIRASAGNYMGLALNCMYRPAITPRVPNTLKATATWTAYFQDCDLTSKSDEAHAAVRISYR